MSSEALEWAANSKTIHAWKPWVKRDGRRWGHKALCGVTTYYEFGWSMSVAEPGALESCRSFELKPVCETCAEGAETANA